MRRAGRYTKAKEDEKEGGFMMLLIGGPMVLLGFVMLLRPRLMWGLASSWRFYPPAKPPEAHFKLVRVVGALALIAGLAGVAWFLYMNRYDIGAFLRFGMM